MDADPMFNLQLRIPPQRSAAISKLNSVIEGPSILTLMRLSRVVVFNRFRNSVLIRFMVENARSHSAVLKELEQLYCIALIGWEIAL